MVRKIMRTSVWAIALLTTSATVAEIENYVFEIPVGQTVSYNVGFVPKQPGLLTIRVEWTGDRVLSMHLKQPSGVRSAARRTGRSPQTMLFDVLETAPHGESFWMLSLRTVSGVQAGKGNVEIVLPQAEEGTGKTASQGELVATLSDNSDPRPADSLLPDWMKSRSLPPLETPQFRFQQAVEQLRDTLIDPVTNEPITDPCHWHEELMTYFDGWSDKYASTGARPDPTHRDYLRRAAGTVEELARFRDGHDPLIHGPIPESRSRYLAWLAIRERKLRPLVRSLDDLRTLPRDGFAPELVDESWPRLFAVCLLSVERHFDQRIIDAHEMGKDAATIDPTPGTELATREWLPLLRAGTALRELAFLPVSQD